MEMTDEITTGRFPAQNQNNDDIPVNPSVTKDPIMTSISQPMVNSPHSIQQHPDQRLHKKWKQTAVPPLLRDCIIKIVSAFYGPSESITVTENIDPTECVPYTRDCVPFLRSLLWQAWIQENVDYDQSQSIHPSMLNNMTDTQIRWPPTVHGKREAFVRLLGGGGRLSMNSVFGDPCPGTSKRLVVHYIVTEIDQQDDTTETRDVRTQCHHVTFAEHEPVLLRRCLTALSFERQEKHGKSVSRIEATTSPSPIQATRLTTEFQEIVLPLVLPFLSLGERIRCRAISRCWKRIIREWGVATIIDANDSRTTNTGSYSSGPIEFTRPILRGLLTHSFASLHSLLLSGFQQLEQDDLHPALSQFQNLKTLDVSRCNNLDDSTLNLLAQHVSGSLQVLYLKGLQNVTDNGMKTICEACVHLEVLDVSYIMNLTDQSGVAIQHLTNLRALYFRDNYQLTNKSLDAITQHCTRLRQLSLWGLIGMRHLRFPTMSRGKTLIILNLWGCHNLGKDLAVALESSMLSLGSLIVSECHQLKDDFILAISEHSGLQQLQHLHLRYLKKLTDTSLLAIAKNFRCLYSLDLSFCSGISAMGIYQLLHECRTHLGELRLRSIRNLDIAYSSRQEQERQQQEEEQEAKRDDGNGLARPRRVLRNDRRNHAGHWILHALRPPVHSNSEHGLCLLDVRHCGGQPSLTIPYAEEDLFVIGMTKLKFVQTVPGFFSRSATIASITTDSTVISSRSADSTKTR